METVRLRQEARMEKQKTLCGRAEHCAERLTIE
jgi:hypothetical protein